MHLVRKYGVKGKKNRIASVNVLCRTPVAPMPVSVDFIPRYQSRPVVKRNLSPINFNEPIINRLETLETWHKKYKRLMKDSLSRFN